MSITPSAVMAQLPAGMRPKRHQIGGGTGFLQLLDTYAAQLDTRVLAYGILWADQTGRIGGTLSMALRKATPWQMAQLVAGMANDGLDVISPVPAWLNKQALAILGA